MLLVEINLDFLWSFSFQGIRAANPLAWCGSWRNSLITFSSWLIGAVVLGSVSLRVTQVEKVFSMVVQLSWSGVPECSSSHWTQREGCRLVDFSLTILYLLVELLSFDTVIMSTSSSDVDELVWVWPSSDSFLAGEICYTWYWCWYWCWGGGVSAPGCGLLVICQQITCFATRSSAVGHGVAVVVSLLLSDGVG